MRSFLFIWFLIVANSVSGQWKFAGKVRFESDAPLEYITAVADKVQGVITPEDGRFAFTVSIKSFEGFNSALQKEHFHENYMDSDKYPLASYSGKLLDPIDISAQGEFVVRTKGKFEVKGVAREKILKHTINIKNGQIQIHSEFTVLLSDFNIHIPRIVLNKISEEIKITVDAKSVAK
ncbi:MAG: YceI family protein [Saprospiraceae bacterium]|nr:YceI family protein [Saprospiraceae bacterium]